MTLTPRRNFDRALSALASAASIFIGTVAIADAPAAPAPKAITLADAQREALAKQPRIRSALARLAARRSEGRIPRAAWMPQLGATAQLLYGTTNNSTASYLGVPEVDLPRIGGTRSSAGFTLSPSASSLLAVTLDQEVFDFGKITSQIAAADALAEEAAADADTARLDVALAVEEAFDAVLAARQVLAAADDASRRAAAHRDFAQAGVKGGLRPPVDLTRAEADLAQAEVRRIRARSGLVTAQSALAASVGSEALELDAAVPTDLAPAPSPTLGEALRLAKERNPVVMAGLARIRAQHATTSAIAGELLPNLFASATLSSRAGGATPSSGAGDVPIGGGWLPDVLNWHAGLVLQWNVFDATVLAKRSASRAREDQARADLDTATSNVVLFVERAYLDLQAAEGTIPSLVQLVAAAQANLTQADARYRAGVGNVIEVADAEALFTTAQVDLAIGRFAADRARAQLGRAIGDSLRSAPRSR